MNISVWFNSYGNDEKYAEVEASSLTQAYNDLGDNCAMIDLAFGVSLDEFDIEMSGDGWTMYEFDGIGLFVVDDGFDSDKCKREYDEWFNE